MAKKKKILYPVLFMIAVTVFFTFMLALINNITKSTIEEQQELVIQKSILYVFDFEPENLTDNAIQELFKSSIIEENIDGRRIFTYKENGEIKGYAFRFSGKGLWGTISGHLAVTPDHQELIGVNFTAHSETPGLGGRIDEEAFKMQFKKLAITDTVVTLNKSTGGNVDAISGATLTSLAVRDIINDQITIILDFAKEEGFYEGN